MLEIKNLTVAVGKRLILRGLNLKMDAGQVHVIMGPNGAGKSTLAKVLAGHPAYEVIEGQVLFRGQDLLEMEPEERAHAGLFHEFPVSSRNSRSEYSSVSENSIEFQS